VKLKNKNQTKVKSGDRETMMQSAVKKIDKDLIDSMPTIKETTSQELFNHLFESCNILRGPINQDEYKSYVTPILFFKRISDVYDEEFEDALARSGGDEEYANFPENHSFIIPEGCHWNDVRQTSQNVGRAIVKAMTGIERANPDTLGGVFSSFDDANWTDKAKLSDERLKNLVEHMSKVKVGNKNYNADVMGDSYEFLIKKFADLSKKNAGEFYTPRSIVKLMIMLLDPKPGETVYDPACGTGGMLIEAVRYMQGDQLTYGRIYGQENNLSTSAIARMNLFLHGAKDFNIKQGDTLGNPLFLESGKLKTFDCVVANPPFSLERWGAEKFSADKYGRNFWGSPTDSNADFAWLQHMIKSMDEGNGRCAVVLPQGVLFRTGLDGIMREKLVKSDLVEAVITLASGVFYSTGVSACIIFLNTKKTVQHKNNICMIDASEIYIPKRAQKIMTIKEIARIYQYYQEYQDVTDFVKIVSQEDIEEKDYSLAVNLYIERSPIERLSPEKVRKNYISAYTEMINSEKIMNDLLLNGGYVNE
jgi:type I restriction enzyme M protein